MKKLIYLTLILLLGIGVKAQKPEMVIIDGGSFYLGNDYSAQPDEKPEHKITLSTFCISKTEITFDMFDNFCRSTGFEYPDDGGFGRGNLPVMNVSWEGAVKFCNWMSARFGLEKVYDFIIDSNGNVIFKKINWEANGYRLPTEAEWEFVAKGGNKAQGFAYTGSNNLDEVAWYAKNSKGKPQEVGTLKANELGVYDILGNSWEWCWDNYSADYYKKSPATDPRGPEKGEHRVYRGGNFNSEESFCRITKRFSLAPTVKTGMVGIRLVQKTCNK